MSVADFMNVLNGSNPDQPSSSPYVPALSSTDPTPATFVGMGLPSDPVSSMPPPGLESTVAVDEPPPHISTMQAIFNTIKNDSANAVGWVETEAKSTVQGIYKTTKSAVGTVYDDVSAPIGNLLKGTYLYLLLGVVVLGGVIYFAGKSGALKIDRVV